MESSVPNPVKLLIVANVPSMLREFLLPYGVHFSKLGWQVDAMVSEATNQADVGRELEQFHKLWRVEWSRNPLDPKNFLKAPKTIREIVSREKYDIVHVHSPVAAFVTRFALRDMPNKPKIIYTAHGFHFHRGGSAIKNKIFLTLEKIAGPWTDHLIVINHEDEKAVKEHNIVPQSKLTYMPGIGVDIRKYDPTKVRPEDIDKVRQELQLRDEDHLLLMIAEFNPGKRHRDALNAFAALKRPNVVLALAGVGPLEGEIKTLAQQLGIAEKVRFLGYRRDIPVLLKAATALLLPSEREGLPRSIMESLCLGTPVISTNIRGVEDLVEGDCGLMTDVGDIPAMTKAMAWMLDNPLDAIAMGQRGQTRMKDFDLSNVVRMHEELYEKILGIKIKKEPVAV
jgi:glycosyltransferase involved in cell wall biosynthesis